MPVRLHSSGRQAVVANERCGNAVAAGGFAVFLRNQRQKRNGQIQCKQRREEPVNAQAPGVQYGVQKKRGALQNIGFQPMGDEHRPEDGNHAPKQERHTCAAKPLLKIFPGVVAGSIVQQGCAADHEKHRDRPKADTLNDQAGEPVAFVGKTPHRPVHMHCNHRNACHNVHHIQCRLIGTFFLHISDTAPPTGTGGNHL